MIWIIFFALIGLYFLYKLNTKTNDSVKIDPPSYIYKSNQSQNFSDESNEFTKIAFGDEWLNFLSQNNFSLDILPTNLLNDISSIFEGLNHKERIALRSAFFKINTEVPNNIFDQYKTNIPTGFTMNYTKLYIDILEHLREGMYSKVSIESVFRRIIIERSEQLSKSVSDTKLKKEKAENDIIDVTGNEYKIPLQPTESDNLSLSYEKENRVESTLYYFEEQKLGNKYKSKLNLNTQEVNWLNKFYDPPTVFLNIEGCCIATVRFYLLIIKNLDKHLKKKESTLVKETNLIVDQILTYFQNNNNTYYTDYYNNQWQTSNKDNIVSSIYLIFRTI
jgi:hypothetical protein